MSSCSDLVSFFGLSCNDVGVIFGCHSVAMLMSLLGVIVYDVMM